MQKVFRLLRHNIETGPFTIGELLQQQIGPGDLIWVDGESTAWAYPQEMDNLKYALSPNDLVKNPEAPKALTPVEEKPKPAVVHSAIHLSPSKEIERKAEELRQRTLSFKKVPGYEPVAWAQQQPHAPILPLAEDVDFVYHKKKGLPVGEVLMAAMVVSLLTLGWYAGGKTLFQQPRELASAVAVKLNTTEENTAIGTPVPSTDTTPVAIDQTSGLVTDSAVSTAINQPIVKRTAHVAMKDTHTVAPKEEPAGIARTTTEPIKKDEEKPLPKPSIAQSVPKEEVKGEVTTTKKAEEQPTAEPEEKKKGFHLFKGLFKKKKKGDDKAEEETKPEVQ